MREFERRTSEHSAHIEKLQTKLQYTEKLAYDFRKDLAQNMNEIETMF